MKKKYLDILIVVISSIIALIYMYYCRPLTDDELFNYGFAKNILDGLIPYRDFNMIILPFFSYLLSGIIFVFGKRLIVYHVVIAIIISFITFFCHKKIGYKSIIIFLLLLVYPYTGYNMFCLFLLMCLLIIQKKHNDILEAIIISMMFLTKQTLVIFVIPSIIKAKNKKKVISIYLIFSLLFLLYLVINNSFYQFFDYCFLGMFDFTSKNNTGVGGFLLLEVLIIFIFSFLFVKNRDIKVIYILLFQIIVFPIVDYFHFIIGFIPVVYYLLIKLKKYNLFTLFSFGSVITFFILLNYGILTADNAYLFMSHYSVNNFMKGRYSYGVTRVYINDIKDNIDNYSDYRPYILGINSYLIKLNLDIPINKYDIINNGNMGYHGSFKYISEIDDYCNRNKCIFFINQEELITDKNIQTNRDILKYVDSNYKKIANSSIINTYSN